MLSIFRRLNLLILAALIASSASGDEIELLSGARIEGKVTQINKAGKTLDFARQVGGRTYTRTYPYDKVHAVTLGDKRYVITARTGADASGSATAGSGNRRTKAEVEALIKQQGSQKPDWFESTPLNYPNSLDLTWPEPPPQKGWNNQKNVGQYIWDIINPNPGRWKEGTRLVHYLLEKNADDADKRERIMNTLGRFYHDLLEDYPRAAFWWHQADIQSGNSRFINSGPHLALCYWRMGNKQMAEDLLDKLARGRVSFGLIKAWGDIGEPKKAIELSEAFIRGNKDVTPIAHMYAADACRTNEMYNEALYYYQKVVNAPAGGKLAKRIEREQKRARASIEAIRLFELCDPTTVADGTYNASSLGYEDQVHVAVNVQGGRIISVDITKHREKQFYSAMTDTPTKIVNKQNVKGVDATSSATLTSEAIINATAKALAQGAR